ncbi:MAG: serine hydrolase [Bacteroidales bacterium]|nr:serine hydrolase [Bacteroidales bacterium]
MKPTLIFASVAAIIAVSCSGPAVSSEGGLRHVSPSVKGMDGKRLELIDSVVNGAVAAGEIPGAVVCVVRDDKVVFEKAYGYKSIVPEKVEMTTDVVFDLASVSKCVGTTLSFMQIVEKGLVRLTDPVKMYIPGFKPWTDPETGETVDIIVRDLLTHSSGLPPYVDVNTVSSLYGEPCPEGLMEYIAGSTARKYRPGSDFTYSCLNFVTLQNILQNVTGMRLCDYAQKNVFDALGLKHTCYLAAEHPDIMPYVAPTEVQPDGQPLLGLVHDPLARRLNAGNSGNAGVFSCVEDLAVISAAIIGGGEIGGRRILGSQTVRAMARIPAENAPHIGRALGWDIRSDYSGFKGDIFNPDTALNHNGYTGTSMVIDLSSRTAVIILTNRVHPSDGGAVGRTRAVVSNIVASSIIR